MWAIIVVTGRCQLAQWVKQCEAKSSLFERAYACFLRMCTIIISKFYQRGIRVAVRTNWRTNSKFV
jgi:hypothetical protein